MTRPATPLLDRVRVPADLRNFSTDQLKTLAEELRAETIDVVSTTGGLYSLPSSSTFRAGGLNAGVQTGSWSDSSDIILTSSA